MRGEVPHEATLYHRDVPSPPPRTSRTSSLPLVPPFIRPPKLLENLRKRRNERASVSPSLYSLSLYLIPFCRRPLGKANGSKNGTDPGYAQEHSEERRERKKEEEEKRKKEGKRSAERTPFTAQWVPLKPKVMKVSGCLSQFLYRAPIHNLTTPYGTHDTYIPGVRLRTTRTMRSIRL